jgi:hypothetical protein
MRTAGESLAEAKLQDNEWYCVRTVFKSLPDKEAFVTTEMVRNATTLGFLFSHSLITKNTSY